MRSHLQFLLVLLLFLGLSPAAEEKRLAVYSPQTSFTVSVVDHDGQEYVSITDLLDPFGKVTLTHNRERWKLRLVPAFGGAIEAEFALYSDTAKIRGKKVQLGHSFWADSQRGYVPVSSTPVLMLQFTRQSTNFRENSRRLFIGDVATSYQTEISKSSNRLILHFSAPVNPTVSTEPGRVRLSFNREPLIPGVNPQSFDNPAIHSLSFSEGNGASELSIATSAPAFPTFSDGNRTITLTVTAPPAQAAQSSQPKAPPSSNAPVPPTPPTNAAAQPPAPTPAPPRFFVIIDPAHGGDDPGATLGNGLFEKDVTLALARRIRNDLDQRGIAAVLLREGDSTISLDQRALYANTSRGSVYISVHASSFGSGVRLYSARFSGVVKVPSHGFLPWNTAQAAYLDLSHTLAASMVTQFESRQIRSMPLESGLRPLRNIAKPAIAVEVAAAEGDPATLTSIAYEQAVAGAIGSGIANLRSSLETRR